MIKISGRKETSDDWTILWQRTQGPEVLTTPRVFCPILTLPKQDFIIKEVRLDLDCRRDAKYTQIEGIELVSFENEKLHQMKISSFLDNMSYLSDITLELDGKKFPSHRIVLANHSPKLFKIIEKTNELSFKGLDAKLFEKFIEYMYTGTLVIDETKIDDYLLLSDQLGLTTVSKECFSMIFKGFDKDNVLSQLIKSYNKEFKYDSSELTALCIKFIEEKCHEVIDSDQWVKIPPPIMKDLLLSSRLVVDELDLFNGLRRWGRENKDYLKDYSQYIRYSQISLDDLKNVIKKSDICPNEIYEDALEYHKNPDKFSKSSELQFLPRGMILFGSKILTSPQAALVIKWVNEVSKGKKWKLAYQATKDGFDTNKFHSLCDKYSESIVIIKSELGNIFGGYTGDSWAGSGYSNNPKSFLFSVQNSINQPQVLKSKGQSNEAYRYSSYGPTFGSGHDLYICSNSNTTASSYTNNPYSFNGPSNFTGTQNTFLAGAYNFKTKEIEVFGLEK